MIFDGVQQWSSDEDIIGVHVAGRFYDVHNAYDVEACVIEADRLTLVFSSHEAGAGPPISVHFSGVGACSVKADRGASSASPFDEFHYASVVVGDAARGAFEVYFHDLLLEFTADRVSVDVGA